MRNKNNKRREENKMQDTLGHITIIGKVIDSVHEIYNIEELESKNIVKGRLSGRLRFNKIQIIVGDFVEMRVSPYDLSHGQITRRLSENDVRRMTRK